MRSMDTPEDGPRSETGEDTRHGARLDEMRAQPLTLPPSRPRGRPRKDAGGEDGAPSAAR